MGSNAKTNSNNSTEDQPTNITARSSCKDQGAAQVVSRTLTYQV